MGPVCKACWWDDGPGPSACAWFTGRNELPGRDPWETRSQVVTADPGEEFAFVVGGTWTRSGYTFTPAADGTLVTESWEMLPAASSGSMSGSARTQRRRSPTGSRPRGQGSRRRSRP